jgi:hypothetical protein
MDKLLPGMGTKLAERWIHLLALPSVLFTVVLAFSWWVRPVGAVDLDAVSRRLTEIVVPKQGTQLAVVAGVGTVIATVCAGIAAEVSRPITRMWMGRGRGAMVLLRPFLRRRIWKTRAAAPAGYDVPERYLPARATRIGDHIRLAEQRIAAQYKIALVRAWPRIWHMSSADERAMTQHAWDRYTAAALRAVWAVGYLLVGLLWWPVAVAGLLLYLSALAAARRAAADLQTAIEALTDVKLLDLAAAVGISLAHGKFTTSDGDALETVLDKGSFRKR